MMKRYRTKRAHCWPEYVTVGTTDYQSMYLAHKLTRRSAGNDIDKLAGAIGDAQVELNPHQIDAALFAFQSPLSKGVILADEVGLGKTIEAGLVMSQLWAERKRRILVIVPAALQKQWSAELLEKFFLPNTILERKAYNRMLREGAANPFGTGDRIVIASYDFAKRQASDIQLVPWDLVVMDEAHFMRNVYRASSKTARVVRGAVAGSRKLLLTATPLQNSLNELYGLVSVIDPHVFGDRRSFNAQYASPRQPDYEHLRQRLRPLAQRTLRRQVTAYIPYTRRIPLVQEFLPTREEISLYELVGDYLSQDHLTALPSSQRHLITLMLQKLQASSTFALAPTLERLAKGVRAHMASADIPIATIEELSEEYEGIGDLEEEIEGDTVGAMDDDDEPEGIDAALHGSNGSVDISGARQEAAPKLSAEQLRRMRSELEELETLSRLARDVRANAKGEALLKGLREAFRRGEKLGAPRKVIIFTEFRRTQDYILELLQSTPEFSEGIVLFNGSNSDPRSKEIYQRWLKENAGTPRVSGSAAVDQRQALVDEFRDNAQIMIATEAAAQGLNLQFCSLIINYDLPWNPQRIEQRIGRCHRYGQKHDVVVVNFLDKNNAADKRVYELLNEKYQLFEGVFGASDDVLGDISAGIDLEKRIAAIYRTARSAEEIDRQFRQLQLSFEPQIKEQMVKTRARLFEHFDEDVAERFRTKDSAAKGLVDRLERDLMALTRHELAASAEFLSDRVFRLHRSPDPGEGVPPGVYALRREADEMPEAYTYRLGHPLAERLLDRAKNRDLPLAHLTFDYGAYGRKISVLERLQGTSGWLDLSLLSLESAAEREDHLIVTAVTDAGERLPAEDAERLFSLPAANGRHLDEHSVNGLAETIAAYRSDLKQGVIVEAAERQAAYLDQEAEKLDAWADDLRESLETELRDLEREVKEAKKLVRTAGNLTEKVAHRRDLNRLETAKAKKAYEIFEKNMEIGAKRDELYDSIEATLHQTQEEKPLFTIRWTVA